jgi:hypothetical protein
MIAEWTRDRGTPYLSYFSYVSSLRTFLALRDLEFNLITFLEAFVTFRDDRAVMHKNIGSILSPDETVTLSVIEPLNCTFHTFHLRALSVQARVVSRYVPLLNIVRLVQSDCQG